MASSTERAVRLGAVFTLTLIAGTAGCEGCGESGPSTAPSGKATASSSAAALPSSSAPALPLTLPACLPPEPLTADLATAKSEIELAKKQLADDKPAAAANHYERACHSGLLDACHAAARILSRSDKGRVLDMPRSLDLLNFACNHGDALGCESLASRYLSGGGVPRDNARAAFKLKCACELGSQEACSTLATIYRDGVGPDFAKGRALDVTACEGEVTEACERLATDYEKGTLVEKDDVQAKSLWVRTYELRKTKCEAGRFGFECAELSRMIREGKGTEKNAEAAHRYAEKACDKLEHGLGCLLAARDFSSGSGVVKDLEAAKTRYAKACASGDVDAEGHKEACDAGKP